MVLVEFFQTLLGMQPALGRGFRADDDQWRRYACCSTELLVLEGALRRGSERHGETIWLDAKPYSVIGVLPSTFAYAAAFRQHRNQVWIPVGQAAPPALLQSFDDHDFSLIARLVGKSTLSSL